MSWEYNAVGQQGLTCPATWCIMIMPAHMCRKGTAQSRGGGSYCRFHSRIERLGSHQGDRRRRKDWRRMASTCGGELLSPHQSSCSRMGIRTQLIERGSEED